MLGMHEQGIQSVGLPPERHADRVVAEMMRELAKKRAVLWGEMQAAILDSADGNPRAQRKLEQRILRAGAMTTRLTPGKRGRYMLEIYDYTGWDAGRDEEIIIGDRIPQKPWIVCYLNVLRSKGGGRDERELKSRALLFITHHCLSRMAQRLGMRTPDDVTVATRVIWRAAVRLLREKDDIEAWLAAPRAGWRVPLIKKDGSQHDIVVLQRHDKREALVAATVMDLYEKCQSDGPT